MKAWRFHTATGGAENHMVIEDIVVPSLSVSLSPGSSLIKVYLVCLNPVDIKFAETPILGRFMHAMPAIPGLDGVGRIVRTRDPELSAGQLVSFRKQEKQADGALAEYVVVSREGCARVPENVSPSQAATVGTCGVTGYQAIAPFVQELRQRYQDQRDIRVFINGGSGGTGTFQIQVAKALGCYVVASCSTSNLEFCKRLGADEVVDYRQSPVEDTLCRRVQHDASSAFDMVIDNVDLPLRRYQAADRYMNPEGIYIQIGGDFSWQGVGELMSITMLPTFLGGGRRLWKFLAMKTSRRDAEQILDLMSRQKINIPIDEEFTFEDVPKAYKKLKKGRTVGKILIRVSNNI
ncbi:hypothetical protein G7046_g426 [Stylonectria norvegica]|nr:hypothetical protein G7046_g426 [Stylonectria norvegica]